MDRRRLLGGGVGLLASGLAGYVGMLASGGGPPQSATDTPDGTPETHDLYVENFDAVRYVVDLTVRRADGRVPLVDATYEVPDDHGFYVPDVLVEGGSYEVVLAVDGRDPAAFEPTVEDCPGDGGPMNVGLWIDDRSVALRQDDCDGTIVGTLPNADHETFRTGT